MNECYLKSCLFLTIMFILWGIFHSLLIARPVTASFQRVMGERGFRYYRIIFNSFAAFTLMPILYYSWIIRQEPFFDWSGYWRIAQFLMVVSALILFYLGAKNYSSRHFLGLAQISGREEKQSISSDGEFERSGVLRFVRHPWYLGTILILWPRDLDLSAIIVNTIFTIYVIIGTLLEERKLLQEYGESYRQYQEEVSMLIPCKWLGQKLHIK